MARVATCLVRSPHTCTWPRPHCGHQANQSLGGSCELRTSITGLSDLGWSQMVSQELRKPLNQRIAPPSGVRLLYPHWAVGAWLQSAYWPASPANSGSPGRHILCLDPAHPLLHLLLLQLHLQTWETLRPAATQSSWTRAIRHEIRDKLDKCVRSVRCQVKS